MLIEILLFIAYTFIVTKIILQMPFVLQSGLSKRAITILFIIKILGSLMFFYVHHHRFYGGDAHDHYLQNIAYLKQLQTDPKGFWHFFIYGWNNINWGENIFSSANRSSWGNLGNQTHIRLLTIFNFISFGHEVVNYIFYTFFSFLGLIALYRCIGLVYKVNKEIIIWLLTLIPSIWFWCSGAKKDAMQLTAFSFMLYYLLQFLKTTKNKYAFLFILFFVISMVFRVYTLLYVLPALFILILNYKKPSKSLLITISLSVVFLLIFFNLNKLIPTINPSEMVCLKQQDFYSHIAGSVLSMDTLKPTATSFLKNTPQALNHVLLQPSIFKAKDAFYFIAGLETIVILLFIIVLLITTPVHFYTKHYWLPTIIFMFLIAIILIGLIVPFSGAFIRYRSEYFALIISSLLATSNLPIWNKLSTKLKQI